jgi:hypothetical protein
MQRPTAPADILRRALVLIGILALVGAACGPTVPTGTTDGSPAASTGDGTDSGGGLSVPGGGDGTTTTTGDGTSGGGFSGGGTSTGTGSSGGGTTSSTGSGGSSGDSVGVGGGGGGTHKVAPSVPGLTDTTISFGIAYQLNSAAANSAFFGTPIQQADARKTYNVMIKLINAQGGLLGRRIVPVYHRYDPNSTEPVDQQDQEACSEWTQDNKVFAIFAGGGVIDECAKKAGAINVGSGVGGGLPEAYRQYPHKLDPDALNLVRMGQVTVDGLFSQGYFDKGAKIGIITWDDPNFRGSLKRGYLPELEHHGLSLAIPPAYVHSPAQPQEIGQSSADVSAAVLRFQTNHIDHVLIVDGQSGACGGTCLTLEWMGQAKSQQYFPRYGFNDGNSAKELYELGALTPEDVRRAVSVGWIDLNEAYDVGWHPNPARERCFDIMRKHGIDMSDSANQNAALAACGQLWLFELAAGKVTGTFTVDGFMRAIENLGYSYTSPGAYFNHFTPTRHDGAAGVRYVRFHDSCQCFRYHGGAYKV